MMTTTLRPITSTDHEFLFSVYAATRADEMALVDWNVEQKESFLRMQFQAQHQYYVENYKGAEFSVIMVNDQSAGRLYLHRREKEIRIMDIALLPNHRNAGIGSALLEEVINQGRQQNAAVTIHVEKFNPAMRLYKRLGFRQKEDREVYWLMEWTPTKHGEA